MKHIIAIFLVALTTSVCSAQGWLDYKLDIGDGYAIWHNNSMDINVANSKNQILIGPGEKDRVGPVVEYSATDRHIFTRNVGKKPRNLFAGDTFQNIDPTLEFFFILTKGTDAVSGPFTRQEFTNHPDVKAVSRVDWAKPKNPNFWLPVLGTLMFVAIAIPILAIKFFWITIPVIVLIIFVIRRIRRNRRGKAQPTPAGDSQPARRGSRTPEE